MEHLSLPPQPLHEIVPSISAAVEQVVLKALVKDPERRFGSMRDFTAAIEQASDLMHHSPGSEQPSPTDYTNRLARQFSFPTLPAGPPDDSLPTLN